MALQAFGARLATLKQGMNSVIAAFRWTTPFDEAGPGPEVITTGPASVAATLVATARTQFATVIHNLGLLNYENLDVSGERHFIRGILHEKQCPIIFDIGAHEGDYSLEILKTCPSAQVYAFEVNPLTSGRLRKALEGKAMVFDFGLGEREEEALIYDYVGLEGSQHASLHREVFDEIHKAAVATTPVRLRRLDDVLTDLGIAHIDLLKVDVEGHELAVLKGAATALSRGMIDIIQFEFNEMNVITRVFFRDFLKLLPGYKFYRLLPDQLLALQPYIPVESELFAFQNIVCFRSTVPDECMRPAQSGAAS
jgi:FkbM family methyltransferase